MINNPKIVPEDFDSLESYYNNPQTNLRWDNVFILPAWLKSWWHSFHPGEDLFLRSIWQGNECIGIAPLFIKDRIATIIGNSDVCDYHDFITVPGKEQAFFDILLEGLKQKDVKQLHLESIRPDSAAFTKLIPILEENKLDFEYKMMSVSLDMPLTSDWESYLGQLDRKQRHEIRRKIRNLYAAGEVNYHVIEDHDAVSSALEDFLKLFPESRSDKAEFMTAFMQKFFRSMVNDMTEYGIIKFGVLRFNRQIVAMVLYFDYNENMYLYNSAYDPDFRSMSVGIISKALCIKDSIQKNKRRFDFLKGTEQYKYYMGGREIPLYTCTLNLQ